MNQKTFVLDSEVSSQKPITDYAPIVDDFYEDILNIKHRLANCSKFESVSVKIHEASKSFDLVSNLIHCGERNCITCLGYRIDRITKSLKPLWECIRPGLRTSHIILTHSPVGSCDYTKAVSQHNRKLVRKFLKKIQTLPFGHWGFGATEHKYSPEEDVFKPHTHIVIFGFSSSAEALQDIWTEINGGVFHKVKTKYPRKKEANETRAEYSEYLTKRKFGIMHYFIRRCASAGLVMSPHKYSPLVPFEMRFGSEYPTRSIPIEHYAEIIKGTRLFFSFGKSHTYNGKKTNIPKGLLHIWEYRIKEIEKKNSEFVIYHLGIIPKPENPNLLDTPPPFSRYSQMLYAIFEELKLSSDLDITHEKTLWKRAFRELCRDQGIKFVGGDDELS
jgi:hypothetical protein